MDNKNLLEKLEQHEAMQLEIKKLEKRLNKFEKQTPTVSDVVQNGYKRHKVIHGVDIYRNSQIRRLKSILKERYNALLENQIQIEELLDKLPSDIRQILEHRYIDNMSWIQIQIQMKYNSESTARMKHDRFFEEI